MRGNFRVPTVNKVNHTHTPLCFAKINKGFLFLQGGLAVQSANCSAPFSVVIDKAGASIGAALSKVQRGLVFRESLSVRLAKSKFLNGKKEVFKDSLVRYRMAYFLEKMGDLAALERHYRYAIGLLAHQGCSKDNFRTFPCRQGRHRQTFKELKRVWEDANCLEPSTPYTSAGVFVLKMTGLIFRKHYFCEYNSIDAHHNNKIFLCERQY